MGYKTLVPPKDLKINFSPSPKQFELWKALQPECHICGGEIKNVYIGTDDHGNKQYVPECSSCGNRNIPQMILGGGAAGGGKAQPYSAKILTPEGWITMGDVKIGTVVSTPDGKTAKVIAIHEQGMKKVNKVITSDGCSTECCDDHLWKVYYKKRDRAWVRGGFDERIMDTATIRKRLRNGNLAFLPVVTEQEFGDKFDNYMTAYSWGYYIRNIMPDPNNFKRSNRTEIPQELVISSLEDRKNFLRGLLKEVIIRSTGKYEFMSRSEKFANQLQDILRSIGAIATVVKSKGKGRIIKYFVRFSFDPRINKMTKPTTTPAHRRYIRSVIELDEHKECRCITLDSDDQLYITDDFLVTHNSYVGSAWLVSSCMRFPNIRAVVARKTIKSLKESTFVTIKKVMKEWGLKEDENFCINNIEGTITFWNESVIMMKEMADLPADLDFSRFGSMEATLVFVDEASEISERAADVMFSRIRWKTSETFKTPKMFLSCNPAACWLRDRFVQDNDGNPVKCRDGEVFIRFSIFDNPDESFRQIYESSLNKIKDNATRERLLYGNWDFVEANEMALYKSFSGDKHLIQSLKENIYDPMKPLILGFDFNVFPHMTCEAVQIDWENKNVYFLEEFLGRPEEKLNNTPKFAQYVKDKLLESKHIGGVVLTGDPAGVARNTQTEDGVNNFTIIQSCMNNTILRPKQNILAKQPPQKNRVDWINELFDGLDGWNIYIDLRCRKLTEDLVYQIRNEDGTKNKQKVTDPKTKVRYEKYGHCFAAGTMITTKKGKIPIENVNVGDYVLTREGYKKVTFSGVTGKNVMVKDYSIGDTNITCTPDHPFYTIEDGFTEIDKITQKTFIVCEKAEKPSYMMDTNFIDTNKPNKSLTEDIIEGGSISMRKSQKHTFIDMFGKNIMEVSQRGSISTILMGIFPIMTYRTLNAKKDQLIYQIIKFINRKGLKKSLLKPFLKTAIRHQNGTNRKKEENGIENMLKKHYSEKKEQLYVKGVERSLLQDVRLKSNIVQEDVRTESTQEYYIKEKKKLFVRKSNERIIDKVYDITVEDLHEFFANGILVHNCTDVADYVLCTFLSKSWLKYQRGGQSGTVLTTSTIKPQFSY